jgi:hypothetical protein
VPSPTSIGSAQHPTPTVTQSPTTTPVAATFDYPLPVHTYYMNSAGTGINYVTTGNYSPSMNYPVGGLSPAIYNPLNGTATSTPYYSGYTSVLALPAATPSPATNPTPSALGAPVNSLEASEFGGSYTANGWKPTATPNPTPGVVATLPGTPATTVYVLPFPIEFFDTREGLYNVNTVATGTGATSTAPVWDYNGTTSKGMYPYGNVPKVGVMSGIDINIANMASLLKGTWDGAFPLGVLSSTAIPTNPGWIIYVSDRRGDRNDNGNYDMEDIYGPLDGILEPGEDANGNGLLDVDTTWEAAPFYASAGNPSTATSGDPNYVASIPTDIGAFFDHQYFRRGIRLINGSQLPGGTALSTGQIVGFTVSAENPIYIVGNYNSTGVTTHPANNTSPPTAPANYSPIYGAETAPALEVPASVVADAVYILSNNWLDAGSFRNPLNINTTNASGPRISTETTVRAAFFTGLTQGSIQATPNQGGGDPNLDGGVHNFPRMLEDWSNIYMNYCGSMVNDFASHQALGAHKNGGGPSVYNAPLRNWTFDTAFLNVNDMPPGTPLFQFVQMTGFHQTTTQEQ